MDKTKIKEVVLGAIIVGLVVWLVALLNGQPPLGQAPSGLAAFIATSSSQTVSTGAPVIFATSTNCTSRVISVNAGSNLMLTFSDRFGQVPSATVGYYQAASTSVAYDAGLWGCGAVKAYGTNVTITTTEFN